MKILRLLASLVGLAKTGRSLFRAGRPFFLTRALDERTVDPDPFKQFAKWYEEAQEKEPPLPNAMIVATVDRRGKPAARVMLLKDFNQNGFVFYTNYESRKAAELQDNPHAAIVFYWPRLTRQVRIEGTVEKISGSESDRYFRTRPRGSKLGAWASKQSEVIMGRGEIEGKLEEYNKRFEGVPVPRPQFWGGYRLKPSRIEFWQGRQDRLHDRLAYEVQAEGRWQIKRLSP